MDKNKALSPDALRVLRAVAERGLRVRWRYRVPNPYYEDNDERMRSSDWRILEHELQRISTKLVIEPLMGNELRYRAWESPYFRLEDTKNTEEYVENRYFLTEYARQLLGAKNGQP